MNTEVTKLEKALANIAGLPILAPLLALLSSRTFISSVIVFTVNLLVVHEPSLAPYEQTIQLMLLVMWAGLASKFSIEYIVDGWNSRPTSGDAAKTDVISEIEAAIKAALDAFVASQIPVGTTTTTTGPATTVVTTSAVSPAPAEITINEASGQG